MSDDWESPYKKEEEEKHLERFLPPTNCERMVVPRVDEHVWAKFDDKTRSEDRSWQNVERLVLQSQFTLQPALEYFLKKEGEEEDKMLGLLRQSAKISSLLHKKLISHRRGLLKPHFEGRYKSLIKKDLPITPHLFGEDLSQKVDSLDKTKNIVEEPKKKGQRNKSARFSFTPGYQSERFSRFKAGTSSNRGQGQPFLGGLGGGRDRQFNFPPKKSYGQSQYKPQSTQYFGKNQQNRYHKTSNK